MITWRLVVVSLVAGVVLAVGSVPLGVVLDLVTSGYAGKGEAHYQYVYGGRLIEITTERRAMVDVRSVRSPPEWMGIRPGFPLDFGDAVVVDRDPRPRGTRGWLDEHGGFMIVWRTGWPLRAAHRQLRTSHEFLIDPTIPNGPHDVGLLEVPVFGRVWWIPALPIWPGLLGNTIFYALLVLMPVALLRRRKLRRRARRGLCLACGYDLGEGVGACPECGLAKHAS